MKLVLWKNSETDNEMHWGHWKHDKHSVGLYHVSLDKHRHLPPSEQAPSAEAVTPRPRDPGTLMVSHL